MELKAKMYIKIAYPIFFVNKILLGENLIDFTDVLKVAYTLKYSCIF